MTVKVNIKRSDSGRGHHLSLDLGFDLSQLGLGDETGDLPPVARHLLVDDSHLLRREVAPGVHLFSERAQDVGVHTTKAHTVVVGGAVRSLFVGGLEGVDLDQTTDRPSRVGGELSLDVVLSDRLHCAARLPSEGIIVNRYSREFLAQNPASGRTQKPGAYHGPAAVVKPKVA